MFNSLVVKVVLFKTFYVFYYEERFKFMVILRIIKNMGN